MDVDQRLRAARPSVPAAEPDPELLARVMAGPVQRRRRPLAVPAVAVVALAAATIVLLGGDRPDTASALSQAMRWFDPPAGAVLHSAMVDDTGRTREFWQVVGDPERSRTIEPSGYELAPGAIYDPASNTIYTGDTPKRATAKIAKADPAGDPLVTKVRMLIADGRAAVAGRDVRDGVEAWKITLTDTADREPWVLWVRTDDGKPLAIDDPGNPSRDKAPEHSRWTTYEVLDREDAPLTLTEAHPDARVVSDEERFQTLLERVGR